MRISTRGRYGLRAMVDLAARVSGAPSALHDIAERQGVSESYLEQVFAFLRKAGLVVAVRGPRGGYELARPPEEISAGDVLRVLEGPLAPVQCVDRDDAGGWCDREDLCAMRGFWRELRDHIDGFLNATTLRDLADRTRERDGGENTYYI